MTIAAGNRELFGCVELIIDIVFDLPHKCNCPAAKEINDSKARWSSCSEPYAFVIPVQVRVEVDILGQENHVVIIILAFAQVAMFFTLLSDVFLELYRRSFNLLQVARNISIFNVLDDAQIDLRYGLAVLEFRQLAA